jgi:CHRD domain
MVKVFVGLGLVLVVSLTACPTTPVTTTFEGTLSGANEVPALTVTGTGTVTATLDIATSRITLTGNYSGLTGAPTVAHIHGPAAAGASALPICNLTPSDGATAGTGTVSSLGAATNPCSDYPWTAQNISDLNAGNMYVNIHTSANKGGEIRAQLIKK